MLKFIFGRPASGKTYTVLEMLQALSLQKKQTVLIVPEQFSFESERAVLKKLGDSAALDVMVTSFSRLCDEIGRRIGGIAGITLNNSDKVIFMDRALRAVSPELKTWQRYCRSVSFARTMLDTVGEFKINAVTSQELEAASKTAESSSLKAKLADVAIIYKTYDLMTGERFIDPADRLTKLYRQLEDFTYFKGKTVFLDSFKGFTGQQFKIIDRILSQADDVIVSLTDDPSDTAEYNIFSNIRKAAEKIRRSAARLNVPETESIILGDGYCSSPELISLEKLLSGGEIELVGKTDKITVCAADTAAAEADFAARTIRKLVRTEGYRYRDFVIIARDSERYEESVSAACAENHISCFMDRRIPLSAFPLSAAVSAAVAYAIRPSTESILKFHKTGLGTLDYNSISELENYTVLWNIEGGLWFRKWDMDPRGFVLAGEETAEIKAELENINALREAATAPLEKFRNRFNGSASVMAEAIVILLEECGAEESLSGMTEKFSQENSDFSSDVLKQSYDKYMKLLDSLVTCFGNAEIGKEEFADALKMAVSFDSVGVIPRMLDEVTFGAADRIRPSRPRVAFILGANQGIFPKTVSESGIFALGERKSLIEMGIEISDNSVSAAIDEDYLVYCNLCCPSDRLYISYSLHGLSGETMERSAFVAEIVENLKCEVINEPQENVTADNAPETLSSAYTEFCRRFGSGNAELKTALCRAGSEEQVRLLEAFLSKAPKSIQTETAKKLFGREIRMSATKFDTFHRCRFSFFCRYGLSAKKLQPADFDVLQRGTIVHYVLEKIIGTYKKSISKLEPEVLDRLTDEYIDEYLEGVAGYASIETAKTRFFVSRISRSLKEVVRQIAKEFAQTEFTPQACELKIGGELPALKLPFDGGNISLVGSIDRLDSYNGYIRVVDYKTGSKKFKLPDILFGLNLQMLIYLYAAVRSAGLSDDKAAGILYMPSKRDLDDKGMAMNGLLRRDNDIVSAMEKDMKGEFIPKLSFTKSGAIDKRCTSFISAEEFSVIFDYIERLMHDTGNTIVSGDIAVDPTDGRESPACKYCDYASVCGIENESVRRVPDFKNDEVFEKMKEVQENGI